MRLGKLVKTTINKIEELSGEDQLSSYENWSQPLEPISGPTTRTTVIDRCS